MYPCIGVPLDISNLKHFTAGRKRNGASVAPFSAGATDSMNIIFPIVRQVIIKNNLDIIHINPASGEQLQKLMVEIYASPPDLVERAKRAVEKPEDMDKIRKELAAEGVR